jgi:hypothetical protein
VPKLQGFEDQHPDPDLQVPSFHLHSKLCAMHISALLYILSWRTVTSLAEKFSIPSSAITVHLISENCLEYTNIWWMNTSVECSKCLKENYLECSHRSLHGSTV